VEHMEHLEALSKRTGKTIKEIADEALALYEKELKGDS